MDLIETFNRSARRKQRHRVACSAAEDRWILNHMATEMLDRWRADRLTADTLTEGPVLIIGNDHNVIAGGLPHRPYYADGVGISGQQRLSILCDEDRLPFADASFATIFSLGMIDTVNDVPGSLLLAKRCLMPKGLFLGAFLGHGSAQSLRSIVQASGPHHMRMHPQIDVRAAGDLMARAGFARSVADMETITARYSSLLRLNSDIRANGGGNALAKRYAIGRTDVQQWSARFESLKDEQGRVGETFCPVYVTGYAP